MTEPIDDFVRLRGQINRRYSSPEATMTNEATSDIDQIARVAREVGIGILTEVDHGTALAFLDGLFILEPKVLELLGEVRDLRLRGVPSSAYGGWHKELCDVLCQLVQQSFEADAEARQKSTAVADALAALGYGNATGGR
jgi:hypothetical protein